MDINEKQATKVLDGDITALLSAFHWSDSPQGSEFWSNIYHRITPLTEHHKDIIRAWLSIPVSTETEKDKWDPENWGV